jgi:Tol biopolymer transport system component
MLFTRMSVLVTAMIMVAVLVACAGAALLAVPKEAEATFPGKNGRIAFTRFPEVGDAEIYKMLPDGSGLKQVTNNSTHDVRPAWSPDGTRISFSRLDKSNDPDKILVKDTRSGQVVSLTDDAAIPGFDAAWSPDGARLAFECHLGGDNGIDICTMNSSDGSEVTNLTNNRSSTSSPPGRRTAPQ